MVGRGGSGWQFILFALAALTLPSAESVRAGDEPVAYSVETRTEPRPLVIHRMVIDLSTPQFTGTVAEYEFGVAMADDPDGDGPIETTLTRPMELAQRENLLAAVNTNAWVMQPLPKPGQGKGYVVGGTANVSGWVRQNGVTRSPHEAGHWSFWIDKASRAHVDENSAGADAPCAVSGFRGVLKAGVVIPDRSEVRHPRTAAGIDRSGHRVTLLVVDGRQAGYSEGVSEFELAGLMKEFGCHDALNLDGGGSTVMLQETEPGKLKVMNRPSDATGPRPVPVMLGIRRVKK